MTKDTKQVIVIRRDLKMRRGKEIAQGSHASLAFLTRKQVYQKIDNSGFPIEIPSSYYANSSCVLSEAEYHWLNSSFAKITLQVPDLESLMDLHGKAQGLGLESHLITDAGRTEFDGVPTVTCLAIGPDWCDKIDEVTKTLKLY